MHVADAKSICKIFVHCNDILPKYLPTFVSRISIITMNTYIGHCYTIVTLSTAFAVNAAKYHHLGTWTRGTHLFGWFAWTYDVTEEICRCWCFVCNNWNWPSINFETIVFLVKYCSETDPWADLVMHSKAVKVNGPACGRHTFNRNIFGWDDVEVSYVI